MFKIPKLVGLDPVEPTTGAEVQEAPVEEGCCGRVGPKLV